MLRGFNCSTPVMRRKPKPSCRELASGADSLTRNYSKGNEVIFSLT
jgi:hypothetical protein